MTLLKTNFNFQHVVSFFNKKCDDVLLREKKK